MHLPWPLVLGCPWRRYAPGTACRRRSTRPRLDRHLNQLSPPTYSRMRRDRFERVLFAPARPCHPGTSVRPPPGCRALRSSRWRAIGVALALGGCTPPGPVAPPSMTEAMRGATEMESPTTYELSYLHSGQTQGARLLLVHGTPGSATGWSDYLIDPPNGMETLALDRPGFGRSGPEHAVTGLAEQAAAVAALLPKDDRPVVLLGHSLGGAIAAWVAAEQPDRVQVLILLAASLDPAQERIHPMQYVGKWAVVEEFLPRDLRNANEELMAFKPELEALQPKLSDITAKVIIMHGTADNLVPFANVDYMKAHLGSARCVEIVRLEGRNHFLPWNSAAEVRDAIAQALRPEC